MTKADKKRVRRKNKQIERQLLSEHKSRGEIIRHHIVNRCDNGTNETHNLLRIYKIREKHFHKIFGNLTLIQAGELLIRCGRAKEAQRCLHQ